jgi:LysM repeat protein
MKTDRLLTASSLLAILTMPVLSPAAEYLLYTPHPVDVAQAPPSPDKGVLVRSITLKRGDTLAAISKKFSGKGRWYPQILLFNSISNPDLIYAGEKLLVPVPAGKVQAITAIKTPHRETHRSAGEKVAQRKVVGKIRHAGKGSVVTDEQALFQKARRAYLRKNYQRAAAAFEMFLQKFPHSPLAADAALGRADCFRHLAGE